VTQDNVIKLSQPGTFADPLTEVLRSGARALLAQAVEAEVATFLSCHADKRLEDGRQRLVRHGHLPEREIVTGIGPVAVRCPRLRDRVSNAGERIRFSSAILPPYARRSKSLEVLLPILYLKGISTGDFEDALVALLGKDAGGLSASTIGRLKEAWSEEHTGEVVSQGSGSGVRLCAGRTWRYVLRRRRRTAGLRSGAHVDKFGCCARVCRRGQTP
jgi:transposase-like protein